MKESIQNPNIGELLSSNRARKGWSIEQFSQDSSIKQEYIEKLENNEFDFINKAYIRSILTTLCEYLEIEKDHILKLYHQLPNPKLKDIAQNNSLSPKKNNLQIKILIPIIPLVVALFVIEFFQKEKIEKAPTIIYNSIDTLKEHNTISKIQKPKKQFIKVICNIDSTWITIYRPPQSLLSKKLLLNDIIKISFQDSLQAISGVQKALSVIYKKQKYSILKFFSIQNNKFYKHYNYK